MNKGLEALKCIRRDYSQFFTRYDQEMLDDIEEELKALEIISDKLGIAWKESLEGLLEYKIITQEEYALLKEVLL